MAEIKKSVIYSSEKIVGIVINSREFDLLIFNTLRLFWLILGQRKTSLVIFL